MEDRLRPALHPSALGSLVARLVMDPGGSWPSRVQRVRWSPYVVGNTWQMELEIKRLLRESPADPRRHLDQDRVRRFAEVLDQLPPVTVFALEDQSLLLVDGYHRLAAAQQAGRTTVRAEVRIGTKAEALQFAVDLAQAELSVSADQARDAIGRYSGRQN